MSPAASVPAARGCAQELVSSGGALRTTWAPPDSALLLLANPGPPCRFSQPCSPLARELGGEEGGKVRRSSGLAPNGDSGTYAAAPAGEEAPWLLLKPDSSLHRPQPAHGQRRLNANRSRRAPFLPGRTSPSVSWSDPGLPAGEWTRMEREPPRSRLRRRRRRTTTPRPSSASTISPEAEVARARGTKRKIRAAATRRARGSLTRPWPPSSSSI